MECQSARGGDRGARSIAEFTGVVLGASMCVALCLGCADGGLVLRVMEKDVMGVLGCGEMEGLFGLLLAQVNGPSAVLLGSWRMGKEVGFLFL